MTTEYFVAYSDNINVFIDWVNSRLKDGWILQGDFKVVKTTAFNERYYQAMIKIK